MGPFSSEQRSLITKGKRAWKQWGKTDKIWGLNTGEFESSSVHFGTISSSLLNGNSNISMVVTRTMD